jgi:hypothetical protein
MLLKHGYKHNQILGNPSIIMSCAVTLLLSSSSLGWSYNSPLRYPNVSSAARHIYETEGARGFFRGFTPCLARAFPANAACFVAFEAVMAALPTKL